MNFKPACFAPLHERRQLPGRTALGEKSMPFESSHSQSDRRPRAARMSAGSDSASCTDCERPTIGAVPGTYNYSHLVGDPAVRNYRISALVSFDELLTPEDRIFLQFGLRIAL